MKTIYKHANIDLAAGEYNMSIQKIQKSYSWSPQNRNAANWRYTTKGIDQVMTYRYPGANITSNVNLKEERQAQTIKADYLRDMIWRNMSLKSKIRIYKTCVRLV
jgi:hypothetical protein